MDNQQEGIRESVVTGSKGRYSVNPAKQSLRFNQSETVNKAPALRRHRRQKTVKKAKFENGRYSGSVLISQNFDGSLRYNHSTAEENKRKELLRRKRMLTRLTSGSYHTLPLENEDFNSSIRKSVVSELHEVTEGEEPVPEEVDPNIDGGWAWVVMLVSLVLSMLVGGVAFSFGTLLDELIDYFETTPAQISLVTSLQKGFYLGMGPIASILIEKFGYRAMGITGSLIACVGFVASSFTPKGFVWVLILTYGVIGGCGFSLIYMTSMVATSLYFKKKRPLAVGIASCGSGIGIFIFPIMMGNLLKIISWQNCVRVQAGTMLLGVFASIAYRPLKSKAKAKDAGKRTIGEHLKSLINWKLFTEPMFILQMVGAMFTSLGVSPPFTYIIGLATEREVNNTDILVSIMGGTNTAGRVATGAVVFFQLVNPMIAVTVTGLIGGVITLLNHFYNQYALLAVYSACHGIVYAVGGALTTEILARTLGTEALSGAFGLICLCRGISMAMGSPIGGALKDSTGSYDASFYLAGACIIGNAVITLIGYIIVRKRGEALDESFDYDEAKNGEQTDVENLEDIPEENTDEVTINSNLNSADKKAC